MKESVESQEALLTSLEDEDLENLKTFKWTRSSPKLSSKSQISSRTSTNVVYYVVPSSSNLARGLFESVL